MRTPVRLIASLLCVLAVSGCQETKKTQKEQATKQWSDARAGVLAKLAADQYLHGNFERAQATVGEALRIAPDNSALHVLAAKLSIEKGELELAELHLTAARKLDPKNPEADYLSGVVCQRWQQPDKAFAFYDTATTKAPNELAYLMAKSESLVAMGRSTEALDLLKSKVVYFEHSAAIRDSVGGLLVEQGQFTEACDMFRQASMLAAEDLTVREHYGLSLFYAKQYPQAVEVLGRLVKSDGYEARPALLAALAESEMQIGQLRAARTHFESAARADESSTGIWIGLARVCVQMNDRPRAEMALRKARYVDPANAEAFMLLGYLRTQEGQLDQALAAYRSAAELDANDPTSLCMVGHTLERMGKKSEARQWFDKALRVKPGDELAEKLLAGVDLRE